jgi:hypothetical protein
MRDIAEVGEIVICINNRSTELICGRKYVIDIVDTSGDLVFYNIRDTESPFIVNSNPYRASRFSRRYAKINEILNSNK